MLYFWVRNGWLLTAVALAGTEQNTSLGNKVPGHWAPWKWECIPHLLVLEEALMAHIYIQPAIVRPGFMGGGPRIPLKYMGLDFLGGSVVKHLPANAGDTGSIPGLERSHMPRNNKACAPELLSLCSRAWEPQLLSPCTLEPVLCNRRSHCNEKLVPCTSRAAPTRCN